MAKEVTAPPLARARHLDVVVHLSGQPRRPQALPVGGQEHRPGVLADEQVPAGLAQIAGQPGRGALSHGHHAVVTGLGLAQGQPAPGQVDVDRSRPTTSPRRMPVA